MMGAWLLVIVVRLFETGFALGESLSAMKLVSIGLILAWVIGLNLSGVTPP